MQELLEQIQTTLQKHKVEKLAAIALQNKWQLKDIIDLTFHADQKIGFRAAWILENIYVNHTEVFLPHIAYFLAIFSKQKNLSAKRHFSKILALITGKRQPKAVKAIIEDYDAEPLLETVFTWLIDDDTPVAIKSHCLNILANLSIKYPWVKEELLNTIDYLIDKESIAFFAKAKQIRKQLKK
ncbi:hypothetical protein [Pedobacter sp.]|uniref:hypothetical protein n=1 Tax=Pedobacter sp. TaxID=1411316 RepID=UPI00396CDDE2